MSTNKFLSQAGFAYFVEKLKLLFGDLGEGKTVTGYVDEKVGELSTTITSKADSTSVDGLSKKIGSGFDGVTTTVTKAVNDTIARFENFGDTQTIENFVDGKIQDLDLTSTIDNAIKGLNLATTYAPKDEFDTLKQTVAGIGNVDTKITDALNGEYSLKKVVRIAKDAGNNDAKVAELIGAPNVNEALVTSSKGSLDFTSKSYVAYVIAKVDNTDPRLSFSKDPDVEIPEVSTVTKGEVNVILRTLDSQLYPEGTHPSDANF